MRQLLPKRQSSAYRSKAAWAVRFACLTIVACVATCKVVAQSHDAPSPQIVAIFANSDSTQANMVKPVTLADGRLLGLSITMQRPQAILGRYSNDDGATWGKPVKLFGLPEHVGAFGYFEAFTDRDGEVHIFFLNDGNTGGVAPKIATESPVRSGGVLDIWQVRSKEKASAWEPASRIWTGRAGDLLSCIQLHSGRIILPISYMTSRTWRQRGEGAKAFTYVGSYSASALYSDDTGKTWKQSSDELTVPTPDLSAIGGVEPTVIELKDGRIWMLIRTQMGHMYESFSKDEGVHWSAPRSSSIISSESPAVLVRLKDQRILLLWNECQRYPYAYGGRHVLHGAVSSDEGRTWSGYREVIRDPLSKNPPPSDSDWGVSYPFATVARNGDVVFSIWIETGKPRSMYRLDPHWLDATEQHTDFAAGANDWSTFGTRGVKLRQVKDGAATTALSIHRDDPDWPAGAVWNFPSGQHGKLHLRIMVQNGFRGDVLSLTDHYSVPFDEEDTLHSVFNLPIGRDGILLKDRLAPDQWHDVALSWDTEQGVCTVSIDGNLAGTVKARRISKGIHYLRFHPAADTSGGSLLLDKVDVKVSDGARK